MAALCLPENHMVPVAKEQSAVRAFPGGKPLFSRSSSATGTDRFVATSESSGRRVIRLGGHYLCMADDKSGRDKQAHDAQKRQHERDIATELERGAEPEPPVDETDLDELEAELDALEFPATGAEVVTTVGTQTVTAGETTYTVAELVPEIDAETYDSPAAVRVRIQRPTVAAAMKRVLEATKTLQQTELSGSQRDAYERTFQELKAIDADDDDEGVRVIGDWILEQLQDDEKLPGSRAVRRQAAKFCRANGYSVRNDEWLGV